MAATFPNGIKTWTDVINNVDDVTAPQMNGAYAEIIAIEGFLKAYFDYLSGSGAKIGNIASGNYVSVEENGTIVLNGAATVWNDLQFAISSGRTSATNAPTWTALIGNLSEYTFAVNDYIDLGSQEIPHNYKEGTDLNVHIHWATNTLDATDRAVKWEIEYSIQNNQYINGIGSTFNTQVVISAETAIPANTPAKSGAFTSIGTISGTGLKMGAQIKMRLRRITSAGTAPTNNPFALQVGIHYECDTEGSRTITAK